MALTSVALFTTSVSAQSPSNKPNSTETGTATAQEPRPGNQEKQDKASAEPNAGGPDNKVAAEKPAADKPPADKPKRDDLKDEIDAVKAENAAVRELLRKMAEQQKTLLEQVDRLQRRLDGNSTTDASIAGKTLVPPATADASAPAANANTAPATKSSRYFTTAHPLPHHRQPQALQQGIVSGKLPTTLRCLFC
jgi:hypothetical protein